MKCEFCGANIDIESPVCPHCGMQKRQFAQHRSEMNAFKTEFDTIKEGVVAENKRFSKKAAYITIICGLIILNLILILCIIMNWDIYKYFRVKDINKHAGEYAQMIEQYEKNEDFELISSYYESKNLYYADDDGPLEEYSLLNRFCNQYSTFILYLPPVSLKGYATDDYSTSNIEYHIDTLVDTYDSTVELYQRYIVEEEDLQYYCEEVYDEQHLKSYRTIIENMEAMIQTYCEFDDAQMEDFKNNSKAYQCLMIEEAMKKEISNDAE